MQVAKDARVDISQQPQWRWAIDAEAFPVAVLVLQVTEINRRMKGEHIELRSIYIEILTSRAIQ